MSIKSRAKFLLSIILISAAASFLTSCYDRTEIDDLAYVIAMGIDKGKTNAIRLTLGMAMPTGGGGGGGGGEEKSEAKGMLVTVIECPTIYAGLNMANSYVSKQINTSHAKIIVFSEEMAKEGMESHIHAIIRGREFRPNMYILISRGPAENFIESVKPKLTNPAKYLEQVLRTYTFSGFGTNSQLINFYLQEESTSRQAVATLCGVAGYKTPSDFDISNSTYKQKGHPLPLEGDYLAGTIPKIGDVDIEMMGLAVFNGPKMVGELDGNDTSLYLMCAGEFKKANMTFPDPLVKDRFVVLDVKKSRNTIRKVNYNGGKPEINVRIILEADISSIQSGQNYETMNNGVLLEQYVSSFLKAGAERFLNKTKAMRSDICGFGNEVKMQCIDWDQWQSRNWLNVYANSTFKVEVSMKIRRPGLMIRSVTAPSAQGGQ